MPQKVEHWPIEKLRAYERNARTHDDEQIRQIAASMNRFGFTNPVLVSEDGEIIAGHGRVRAARDLGWEKVPVIVLDHLTPEERRAYVIADNQLALNAGWDEELLRSEVISLSLADFDLGLLGFDDGLLADLLNSDDLDDDPTVGGGDRTPPDEFPEADDDLETDYRCPSCGYEWSGKEK